MDLSGQPSELYDPIRYMMQLGGKRIRPVLVLMANELFGGKEELAMPAALGIEVFHNFTLLHDDIMDKAPLRRAKPTVHVKWNSDIAILSGDTMFVRACQLMTSVESRNMKKVLDIFYKTAVEVCEGQQMDMNFETAQTVTIQDYIHMISLKTAVLLGASLAIGAVCADASEKDTASIYEFGKNLGIAFQLHDDILDVYADQEKFGKQVGGDIIANKKTFLLLKAMEMAKGDDAAQLRHWLNVKDFNSAEKVKAVTGIYDRIGIKALSEKEMDKYFTLSMDNLHSISVHADGKEQLIRLAEQLMVREK